MQKLIGFIGCIIIFLLIIYAVILISCEGEAETKRLDQIKQQYHNTLWLNGYLEGKKNAYERCFKIFY